MSFTWNPDGDLTTALAKVRLRIGDTDSSYPIFTDAEINGVLTWTAETTTFDITVGILMMVMGTDPDRMIVMRNAISGSIPLIALMNDYADRARGYFSNG